MKILSIASICAVVVVASCSKKEEQPAPGSAPASAVTSAPSNTSTKPQPVDADDEAMGTASGLAGAATGSGQAVVKSTADAISGAKQIVAPASAERLALEYLKGTSIGKEHPNEITLTRSSKGACDDCWFFTYTVGTQEVKVQTAGSVAALFGTMKEIKKGK
jgi:hypothetical protein